MSNSLLKSHAFLVVLAGGHIVMVALGSVGIDFRAATIPPTQLLRWYGAITGANNRYGFFAPEVQTPTRVAFTMTNSQGERWNDTLEFGATSESNLRLATVTFSMPLLDEHDQDLMMRSLAAQMFQLHPEAETVELRFEAYGVDRDDGLDDFPSMAAYRAGDRAEWVTLTTTPPFRRELTPKYAR